MADGSAASRRETTAVGLRSQRASSQLCVSTLCLAPCAARGGGRAGRLRAGRLGGILLFSLFHSATAHLRSAARPDVRTAVIIKCDDMLQTYTIALDSTHQKARTRTTLQRRTRDCAAQEIAGLGHSITIPPNRHIYMPVIMFTNST